MAEELFGWLFIGSIPLLYEKKKVARQFQVEAWLDLTQVLKELELDKVEKATPTGHRPASYIV
ncbi:MAG: hypothetical protein QHH24_05175 [Candidatus Bathyarchaeota archaeon]|nr:hypothetical protein [Candidatus Bathyarchaeota archaeon]